MIKQYQSKIINLEHRIKVLELELIQKNVEFYALEKENQDLHNQLRDAIFTAEERLGIIKTLPDLNNYCEVRNFKSKL